MIAAETLEQIASTAATMGELNAAAMASLKKTWPDLRFTFCSDDDMPARMPSALQRDSFKLYLVGGGEHSSASRRMRSKPSVSWWHMWTKRISQPGCAVRLLTNPDCGGRVGKFEDR